MTEKSEIPCKDCITLGICKAQLSKDEPYSDVVQIVIPKCTLIAEFVTCKIDTYEYHSMFSIEKVMNYLIWGTKKTKGKGVT